MQLILMILILFSGYAANVSTELVSNDLSLPVESDDRISTNLIGFTLDEQDRKVVEQSSPRTLDRIEKDSPLTINDVIKLSQAGVSDDTIIEYLHEQSTSYLLTQPQIRRLHDAGVSSRVIQYMTTPDR